MEDSPGAMKRTCPVPEIKPLDQYDISRAKICASVRWLLSKSYGSAENVPVEFREPLYKDQYKQEHLKPAVSKLLLSPEIYCRAQALLAQAHGVSVPAVQGSPADNSALLQHLIKKGFAPRVQEVDVTEEDLSSAPIKTKSHLALIDSLMSLAAEETVGRVKMAVEAGQMGVGAPWENALLFWVNRLNQKLRESTEEEEPLRSQTCTDLQSVQDTCPSNRWYWKLVPHAIAFCLKESGNKPPVVTYNTSLLSHPHPPRLPWQHTRLTDFPFSSNVNLVLGQNHHCRKDPDRTKCCSWLCKHPLASEQLEIFFADDTRHKLCLFKNLHHLLLEQLWFRK